MLKLDKNRKNCFNFEQLITYKKEAQEMEEQAQKETLEIAKEVEKARFVVNHTAWGRCPGEQEQTRKEAVAAVETDPHFYLQKLNQWRNVYKLALEQLKAETKAAGIEDLSDLAVFRLDWGRFAFPEVPTGKSLYGLAKRYPEINEAWFAAEKPRGLGQNFSDSVPAGVAQRVVETELLIQRMEELPEGKVHSWPEELRNFLDQFRHI